MNGKIRERFVVPAGTGDQILKNRAQALPKVQEWIVGKEVAKVVVVKDKLVNIVLRHQESREARGSDTDR
ncbi:MAG: Leucine--tRNA ligase [Spirochaetes bacterium]|nr:MAG: Leucine--tRNA ligase [Spirochaetota bacterium]